MSDKTELVFQKNSQDNMIEVWQQENIRWLTINSVLQTSIDTKNPQHLTSPVYPAFLIVLLFVDRPKSVMLAGVGGGAIARFLNNKAPKIKGDAIEINATITNIAKKYFEFPTTSWKLIVDDIRRWSGRIYDLIFLDIADAESTPIWLTDKTMIEQMKKQLSPDGVLVFNLMTSEASIFSQQLQNIREAFERRTLCLSVPNHKNIIVFAFNQPASFHTIDELKLRLRVAKDDWGIDFKTQLEQLRNDNPIGSGVL